MTTLTIQIPDNKAKSLLDFVKKLGGTAVEEEKLERLKKLAGEVNEGIPAENDLSMEDIVKEIRKVRY